MREAELFVRIGGEEFAILMPNTGMRGANWPNDCEALRSAAVGAFQAQEIGLHISVGVTRFKPSDPSIEDCLRRSEPALQTA